MKLISIIDDDPVFCKVLAEHLMAMGYEARVYNSGKDFLSKQREEHLAIILDHYLNQSTGLDHLTQIQKKLPGVPVIYLTLLPENQLPVNFKNKGIHAYIGKDSASLVRLRTILDTLKEGRKKNWLQRLFGKS
jgi:FixJ family two-component response regulator